MSNRGGKKSKDKKSKDNGQLVAAQEMVTTVQEEATDALEVVPTDNHEAVLVATEAVVEEEKPAQILPTEQSEEEKDWRYYHVLHEIISQLKFPRYANFVPTFGMFLVGILEWLLGFRGHKSYQKRLNEERNLEKTRMFRTMVGIGNLKERGIKEVIWMIENSLKELDFRIAAELIEVFYDIPASPVILHFLAKMLLEKNEQYKLSAARILAYQAKILEDNELLEQIEKYAIDFLENEKNTDVRYWLFIVLNRCGSKPLPIFIIRKDKDIDTLREAIRASTAIAARLNDPIIDNIVFTNLVNMLSLEDSMSLIDLIKEEIQLIETRQCDRAASSQPG